MEHPIISSVVGAFKVPGSCSVPCEDKQGYLEQSTEGTQFLWKAKGSSVYPTDAAALVMNRRLIESCLASAEPESSPPSFSSVSLGPKTEEYLCRSCPSHLQALHTPPQAEAWKVLNQECSLFVGGRKKWEGRRCTWRQGGEKLQG